MAVLAQRRFGFGVALALFCVANLTWSAAAARPTLKGAKVGVDLRQHPTGGKTPVEVSIGLYVTNLVAIDETRENFEVGGYLTGKWQDPRLILTASPTSGDQTSADRSSDRGNQGKTTRSFRVEDLWTPPIEAANSVSHKTNSYSLEADANGTVTYVERFDAVLSNNYELRKFPFDTQVLQFEFQPFLSAVSDIRFAAQALPFTGISPEQHTELAAWRIKDLRYTAEKVTSDRFVPAAREALFQIVIERRSGFYLWKIFLPLMLLTMIPTLVFWIDVKEFDWILKVPMTMLLSMVAFEFAIARDLPRIGYVTFLDAVFLASFAFCVLCIVEITLVFLMQKAGRRNPAVKLHLAGRWAYPLAYFVVLLFLAICFL
jgi:Neurotransmitter-gated ion-channel ligand binding domain